MSNLRQLKVTFDSFDDLVESIGPGLSRTHLFARTDEEIAAGTRVRLELRTARKGALIRGVAKVAGPADEAPEPGLHLHIIHLDPSSTRLVDSIVRGEIGVVGSPDASGPSPFDIASAEPPEARPAEAQPAEAQPAEARRETAEPPARGAAGRFRLVAWPLALAALGAVSLLVFKGFDGDDDKQLLTGRDRQTESAGPAEPETATLEEATPETDTSEPVEPAPAEPQPGTPPSETTAPAIDTSEPAAPDTAAEGVERTVRAWAAAWSRQDPDAYLELYAPDYSPAGLDRDAWERRRRARVTAPEELRVSVLGLEVEIVDPDRATARFQQLYATRERTLSARKVLELERSAGGWKIVAERLEP